MSNWLIRFNDTGSALIWRRKYFLGLVAIPWSLHGGTRIIRTPDCNNNVLEAALEYIKEKTDGNCEFVDITVKL